MYFFRITMRTAQLGLLISFALGLVYDIKVAETYLLGVSFSILYLYLLQVNTDTVGIGNRSY